jgi:hypothetical protein
MLFLVNYVTIYFKKTRNNLFLILNFNKSIKIFNIGNLSLKNKAFSFIFEVMFSKIVDILKK